MRWVVRDEYPDLGIWRNLDKSKLLIPLGNEIARVTGRVFFSKNLGLKRKNAIIDSLAAYFQVPRCIQTLDIIERLISVPILGSAFIALRRKFERRK